MMVMTINNNCLFQLLPSEKQKQQYQTKLIWIKDSLIDLIMEVYDGNSETLHTAQCSQGSQFVVELLKIPCKRVIFIKKVKP